MEKKYDLRNFDYKEKVKEKNKQFLTMTINGINFVIYDMETEKGKVHCFYKCNKDYVPISDKRECKDYKEIAKGY